MPLPTLAAVALLAAPPPPARPAGLAPDLAPPVRVATADGRPVDVERHGHAAPCVGDLDGDGKPDLLVGQFDRGRLRVYRNTGTPASPELGGHDWFMASDAPGTVPPKCYMGFTPQLVDLDGDGRTDVLSGSYAGEIYYFRRGSDGRFAGGQVLTHAGGKAINVNWSSAAVAADWDGDGKPDLIIGTGMGDVVVLPSIGTRADPAFGDPKPVTAGGGPIKIPSGMAAPAVADWDGDGRPDLLVGDVGGWFEGTPARTAAEAAEEADALARLPGVRAAWAAALRDLTAATDAADPDAGRVAKLRKDVARLKDEVVHLQDVRDRYRPQSMTHGHVWLFRRRPPAGP